MPNYDFERILGRVNHSIFDNRRANIVESFRPDQIKTKKWLTYEITRFKTEFKKVAVLGSWNSILLYELMNDKAKVGFWDFYDIEETVHRDRDYYFQSNNMEMNYNSFTSDVTTLFYQPGYVKQYDLIINPSCEHMVDITAIEGPLYALTSNNYKGVPGHINTIETYEDLAIKNGINNILYQGKLSLTKYDRYCTIGYAK